MAVSTRITAIAATAILMTGAAPLAAQETGEMPVPAVEVSAGYVLLHDTVAEDKYPGGWYFSAVGNLNRWFGVVGETSGSYRSEVTTFQEGAVRMSTKAQVYTFMGGGRFFQKAGRLTIFGQMLAGLATHRLQQTTAIAAGFPGGPLDSRWSPSSTNLALQPGGGVTVYLSEHAGVRAAADYRVTIDREADNILKEARYLTGFTFRWGRR